MRRAASNGYCTHKCSPLNGRLPPKMKASTFFYSGIINRNTNRKRLSSSRVSISFPIFSGTKPDAMNTCQHPTYYSALIDICRFLTFVHFIMKKILLQFFIVICYCGLFEFTTTLATVRSLASHDFGHNAYKVSPFWPHELEIKLCARAWHFHQKRSNTNHFLCVPLMCRLCIQILPNCWKCFQMSRNLGETL